MIFIPFLPWQGFYCVANHCISPLLNTHPGAMSAGWWRLDWLYTRIGDGHLQPPLCSDKMALCLRAHPPLSLLLGRYVFLTQISDQVSLVPKHSLRITGGGGQVELLPLQEALVRLAKNNVHHCGLCNSSCNKCRGHRLAKMDRNNFLAFN